MINRTTMRVLKGDIYRGIVCRWFAWIATTIMIVGFCWIFYFQVNELSLISNDNIKPTITDSLLFFFRGMKKYVPVSGAPFELPIIWLIPNFVLGLIIAKYPTNDLHGYGKILLIESGNRRCWITSKYLWVYVCVIIYYLILYIVIILFSLLWGSFSLDITTKIFSTIFDFYIIEQNTTLVIFSIVFLPLTTSLTLCSIQLLFEIIIGPVYSFLMTICLLISSAYFFSPFLIGNYSMILRSNLVIESGINIYTSFICNIILQIISLIGGITYFNKKDILSTR